MAESFYRGRYDSLELRPYKLSRSGIESYIQCKRCFYLDRVLGINQPSGAPFTLNNAVDYLLKKEFDINRAKRDSHPLMKSYGIDAIPFTHENIDKWRTNFQGVEYLHEETNLLIFGAVDDIWEDSRGNLIVADYKATSKAEEVNLDAEWQMSYKRQMELYQWLLRRNGFNVNNTGYFVYCNGIKDKEAFDAKLEFDIKILPYTGNDEWVEPTVKDIKLLLDTDTIPDFTEGCEWCNYQKEINQISK